MNCARPARVRAFGAAGAVVIVLFTVSACGVVTPLCDQGASLVDAGALDRATEAYAQAAEAGEGSCASAGLAAAAERYTNSYANVALGRTAEGKGEVPVAVAAYKSALALDDSNPAAREALGRLGQPVPELREPDAPPPREAPGEPRPSLIVFVTTAATATCCLLLGLTGWAVRWGRARERRRQQNREATETASRLNDARMKLGDALDRFGEARAAADRNRDDMANEVQLLADARAALLGGFDAVRKGLDEAVTSLRADADRQAAELHTLIEDLADYVGERIGGPSPVSQRFEMAAVDSEGEER